MSGEVEPELIEHTPSEDELVQAYVWCGWASLSDFWEETRTKEARRALDRIRAEGWAEGYDTGENAGALGLDRQDNPHEEEK